MSKAAAIHTAVLLQFASEGKTARGLNEPLGSFTPPGAAAATPAAYDPSTIRGFLANVAFRLRSDTPPLAFNWGALDPNTAVTDKLWVLEMAIADATTILPAPETKDKPVS